MNSRAGDSFRVNNNHDDGPYRQPDDGGPRFANKGELADSRRPFTVLSGNIRRTQDKRSGKPGLEIVLTVRFCDDSQPREALIALNPTAWRYELLHRLRRAPEGPYLLRLRTFARGDCKWTLVPADTAAAA